MFLDDADARTRAEAMQAEVRIETDVDLMSSSLSDFLEMKISPKDADDFHDINGPAPKRYHRTKVCMGQIKDFLDAPVNMPPNWGRLVGKALRQLGWEPKGTEYMPGYGKPKVYKPTPATKARFLKSNMGEPLHEYDVDDLV